ncbi:MAG: hypothetical protein ABJQ71_06050 [Roseibium sp.]
MYEVIKSWLKKRTESPSKKTSTQTLIDFDVLFLSSSSVDEVWIRSTALASKSVGLNVAIAICDSSEGLPDTIDCYRLANIPFFDKLSFSEAAEIQCRIAVTASSGLDRSIFPTPALWFIHMPHSIASLHMIYDENAFSGYDALFSVGPHHDEEYREICERLSLENRFSLPVGYGKLDEMRRIFAISIDYPTNVKTVEDRLHVLLAPSWGPDNLLDRLGEELIQALVHKGYEVTIRPHPLFFIERPPIMEALTKLSNELATVTLESSLNGNNAVFSADLLIGDYSGTSFEFHALRGKPVISVDVGLKIVNENWRQYTARPIEISLRDKLGRVVEPDITKIVEAAESLFQETNNSMTSIVKQFLHSPPGECADRAVHHLKQLLLKP